MAKIHAALFNVKLFCVCRIISTTDLAAKDNAKDPERRQLINELELVKKTHTRVQQRLVIVIPYKNE